MHPDLEAPPVVPFELVAVKLPNGFELRAYTGSDGATVVEIDTALAYEQNEHGSAATHDIHGTPWLRVYVNEAVVDDESPRLPLPGSRDASPYLDDT